MATTIASPSSTNVATFSPRFFSATESIFSGCNTTKKGIASLCLPIFYGRRTVPLQRGVLIGERTRAFIEFFPALRRDLGVSELILSHRVLLGDVVR